MQEELKIEQNLGNAYNIRLIQDKFNAGDVVGNFANIHSAYQRACVDEVDLILLPELALSGYMAQDCFLDDDFIGECQYFIEKIIAMTTDQKTAILVGAPLLKKDKHSYGAKLYNGVVFARSGKGDFFHKNLLPYYGEFNENRYFSSSGEENSPFRTSKERL